MVSKLYSKTCPELWNRGIANDAALLRLITFGYVHKYDFVQMLVDDYMCWKKMKFQQKGSLEGMTISDWCDPSQHGHFKQMQNVKIIVDENALRSILIPYGEAVKR